MDYTAPVTTISNKLPLQIHRTARNHEPKEKAIRAASRIAKPQPPNTNKTILDRLPPKNKISPSKILRRSTPSRQPTQNTTDSKPAAYSLHMTSKQSAPTFHNKTSTDRCPAKSKKLPSKTTRRSISFLQTRQNNPDIKPAPHVSSTTNEVNFNKSPVKNTLSTKETSADK